VKTKSLYRIYLCGKTEQCIYTAKTKRGAFRFVRSLFPIEGKWFSIHHKRIIKNKENKLRAFDGTSIKDIYMSFKKKGR
jgi:hypothetical protein